MPRFIAKKGRFAKDETWWKFGILYEESESTTALVKVDYPSKIIAVSTQSRTLHAKEFHDISQILVHLINNEWAF